MNMNILNFDFDTETGFVWMTIDGKKDGETMTVQACLKQPEFDPMLVSAPDFLKEIDCSDCGHNDGICGEVNEKAFEYWGENRCMKALFTKAEENGITLS